MGFNWKKYGIVVNRDPRNFIFYLFIAIIILGYFYWYGYRPMEIRKECLRESLLESAEDHVDTTSQSRYDACLEKNGLEK